MNISIVILVYNEEKYIEKCLDSLRSLNKQPYEIIAVDNNSTDRSVELIKQYPEVTLVHETTQGMTPTRNRGFNEASGDIIVKIDADTRAEPDWIEVISDNFTQHPEAVALAGHVFFYDSLFPKSKVPSVAYSETVRKIYKHHVLMGPGYALRKSAWKKVKDEVCPEDNIVHEDVDISIHLAEIGEILFDPQFRIHSSARRIQGNPKSFFIDYGIKHPRIWARHKEIMKKRHLPFLSSRTEQD